ncbi:MAG: apolipoprotein N-acyltransferase, partial [Candidatus Sedimenticola sp. 4PFRAG1]
LAPLLGVYGVSLGVTLSAAGLALVLSGAVKQRWGVLTPVILLWLSAGLLLQLNWTASSGGSLSVSMIQGNVAQEAKWKRENLQPTLALYGELTRQHWGSDLII